MQALRDEMDLRDQTREVENARPSAGHQSSPEPPPSVTAETLSRKQERTAGAVRSAIDDIRMLDHPEHFQQETALLTAVVRVMDEASTILARPDTGPDAIAAETEAIELLLQARRNKPGGGGSGGGGAPGGGSGGAARSNAALASLGPGTQSQNQLPERNVDQATGHAGRELPEEFRSGLDAYFHALEQAATNR